MGTPNMITPLDLKEISKEQAEFNRLMNWCADMEAITNPKLAMWADEWLRLNFGEGVLKDDLLEISATNIRRLICAAYAKGRLESPTRNDQMSTLAACKLCGVSIEGWRTFCESCIWGEAEKQQKAELVMNQPASHQKQREEIAEKLGNLLYDHSDVWTRDIFVSQSNKALDSLDQLRQREIEQLKRERDEMIAGDSYLSSIPFQKLVRVWDRVIDRIPGLSRKLSLGALDELAEHLGIAPRNDNSDEYVVVKESELSKANDEIARLRKELTDRENTERGPWQANPDRPARTIMTDERLTSLLELESMAQDAFRDIEQELEDLFPRGSKWKVKLNRRQKKFSVMEVRDYSPWATPGFSKVRFQMPRKNDRYGRMTLREVRVADIIEPV